MEQKKIDRINELAHIAKERELTKEEKDALREDYGLLQTTEEGLLALAPGAVRGKRVTPYGVSAIVRRDAAPVGLALEPVSIEDLFILMVKEGEQ